MSLQPLHDACEVLGRRVCPIYRIAEKGRRFLVGSGTLVAVDGESFLLTATHVLHELQDDHLIIAGTSEYIRFAAPRTQFEYAKKISVDVDVAAVHLPTEVVSKLSSFYEFSTTDELGSLQPYDKLSLYALVGYPHTKNRPKPLSLKSVTVKPYYFVLREHVDIADLPPYGKSDKVHFAFAAPMEMAMGVDQERRQFPVLNGVSGGGIWKIVVDKDTGNLAKPLLVGIGIEHRKGDSAIVGTRVEFGVAASRDVKNRLTKR